MGNEEMVGREPAEMQRVKESLNALNTDFQIMLDDPDWHPESNSDWEASQDHVEIIHAYLKSIGKLPQYSELVDIRLMAQEEYAKNSTTCPACFNKHGCSGGDVCVESDGAHITMTCKKCGACWVEVYELTGYTGLEKE